VDGNTDGYFLNKSTTHTHYEQGAWWQVDLGGEKNIKQIIIHNRTDCCVDRLSLQGWQRRIHLNKSWYNHYQEVQQVRPLIAAIPRFIQMHMPLQPLKPMDQSRRGVMRAPHAVIDPSASRVAKAYPFE
jgi:hypothetical protein